MNAKYTAKVLRDGGLAVLMTGMAVTRSLENAALTAAAIVCAIGAGLSVLIRMPMVVKELNGFRAGFARGVTA